MSCWLQVYEKKEPCSHCRPRMLCCWPMQSVINGILRKLRPLKGAARVIMAASVLDGICTDKTGNAKQAQSYLHAFRKSLCGDQKSSHPLFSCMWAAPTAGMILEWCEILLHAAGSSLLMPELSAPTTGHAWMLRSRANPVVHRVQTPHSSRHRNRLKSTESITGHVSGVTFSPSRRTCSPSHPWSSHQYPHCSLRHPAGMPAG